MPKRDWALSALTRTIPRSQPVATSETVLTLDRGDERIAPRFIVRRRHTLRRQARFDRIGDGQFPSQHPSDNQAMYRKSFFEPFLQAPGGAGIDPFQLSKDFCKASLA